MQRQEIKNRPSKVVTAGSAKVVCQTDTIQKFLHSLPDYLGGGDFKILVDVLRRAKRERKPIIWGFGAHAIKVGLTPVLRNLIKQGWVSGLAVNGAFAIHDYELGMFGRTSEYVESVKSGEFGTTSEIDTLNLAATSGFIRFLGLGESLPPLFHPASVIGTAHSCKVPVTIHAAIGTDVTILGECYDGAAWGRGSSVDFERFTKLVRLLEGGGVYLNVGSAVVMPEVFLKAVATVRARGGKLDYFWTAVLDFLKMYRPLENVTRRPLGGRGRGFYLVGQHELLVPLLAACLVRK